MLKRKLEKVDDKIVKTKKFLDDYHPSEIDESTYEPTDPDGIKHCFLLCAVGPPGSGKTHALAAYVENLVNNKDIWKLYILSPTYHNNAGYFKNLKIEMDVCDEMKDAYGFITKLKEEQLKIKEIWKEVKKQYSTLVKFETFVKYIKKNESIKAVANMRHPNFNGGLPHTLDERAKQYMDQKGIKEKVSLLPYSEYILSLIEKRGSVKNFYEKPPICLLFTDDIQGTKLMSLSRTSPFINFLIKHRHYLADVMFGVHTPKALPPAVRPQVTDWMIFKIHDPKLLRTIYEEAANAQGEPDDFEEFFKENIDGENNRFLMINKKDRPLGARFGWGGKGEKRQLKDMMDEYKSGKEQKVKENTFHYTDARGKKQPISFDLDLPIKKKMKP